MTDDSTRGFRPEVVLADLVAAMQPPRMIILMVPAGDAVDQQIAALTPLLGADDLVIDAGNANFHDTNRRARAGLPFRFAGIGVSGGEEGARHGPSIMAGGTAADWARMQPVLTAIAARAEDGRPCAAWMGPEGAGHFVKAVHNGIEYADMQMIAEVYGVMRDGLGMAADAMAKYLNSNETELFHKGNVLYNFSRARRAMQGADGADTLIAGDLGCLMNMAGKLQRQGLPVRVYHTAEVLAGKAEIPPIAHRK